MTNLPRPRARHLATLVALLVLAVAALHMYAEAQWRASYGDGPYESRYAAAERAAAIEPFNPGFRARPYWLRGERYLAEDQPANAYFWLRRAIEIDGGNQRLRDVYLRAYAEWSTVSARKAHVQHGKEGTGGVLRDEDVQR